MKLYKVVLSLFFLASTSIYAQNNTKPVAKIGSKSISVEEFKERFEFVPQLNRTERNEKEKKKELLETLIAEKLFALQAEKEGYDTTDVMQNTYKALEEMYVRDALFKNKIKDKVKIKKSDLLEGYNRSKKTLIVSYIYSKNADEIKKVYKQLQAGAKFDSLLKLRQEFKDKQNPYTVNFGQMDKKVEDALYSLKVGENTIPVESPDGYYIFKLDKAMPRVLQKKETLTEIQKKVRQTVEDRKEGEVFQSYYQNFFNDKEVTAKGTLFWSIAGNLAKIIKEDKEKLKIKDGGKIVFSEENLKELENRIGPDTLKMILVKINGTPVSVKKFLREFMFEGFYTNTVNPKIIASQLNSRVKRFISLMLLSQEGYKEGLNSLPSVKSMTEMWRDNYLAQLYKSNIIKSVKISDNDALKYYQEKYKTATPVEEVNIIEILTDSLEVVNKVLKALDKDADIRELAKMHTKRKWTKDKGGEFGYFPVTMYGDIGKIAGEMKVGEIYGPLKTNDGYSIFKLIGKRKPKVKTPKAFNDIKNEIKSELRYKKVKNKLENRTAELASKYGVSINNRLLNSIKVNNLNMLVYRYMGFGGRILAFPITPPFYEWYQKWKSGKQILP